MIEAAVVGCKIAALVLLAAAGRSQLVWYTSPIDGTRQAYGVYLPASQAPSPRGYPAIFHGHGYGWSVSDRFSQFQRRWADEHGFVLININARGPTFYEGIGQKAVYEVVADAVARFGLDRSRLYFTGASMGGTGAIRQGVRHPDVFAAVAAVDGWADWRLWHHHWYARTDMRDLIEEFRRPLLCSVAPLFWPHRAAWGAGLLIADGRDTVVWPDNSIRLAQALAEQWNRRPGDVQWACKLNYDRGHGGGYRLREIYDFFLRCPPAGLGRSLCIRAWRLAFAHLGWLAITGIECFGRPATVWSVAAGDVISVWTDNVSRLEVYPAERPWANPARVRVYVDGFRVWDGPARLVRAERIAAPDGAVLGWRTQDEPADELAKRPGLEGPIGDAFTQPFIVAYATAGPADQCSRHRREAEQFVRGWNSFFVHGPGIRAVPEDAIRPEDLRHFNLILFGCLDCSRLLRLADSVHPFPIRVRHGEVALVDGDMVRIYRGDNFGCFFIYPNPLAPGRYIVVASGQFYTKPDGRKPAGLEYDLEKLPWAYPDYVVFNSDQSQLPFVLNVNNKPPVTCYEAAYFAEAGYFDDKWRVNRWAPLRWARAEKPEGVRFMHVKELSYDEERALARVVVVDDAGKPVEWARVTIFDGAAARSGVTNKSGAVEIAARRRPVLLCVMATGAVHDPEDDVADAWPRELSSDLAVRLECPRAAEAGEMVEVSVALANLTQTPVSAECEIEAAPGRIWPQRVAVPLPSRGVRTIHASLRLPRSAGRVVVQAAANSPVGPAARRAETAVYVRPAVRVASAKARACEDGWEVEAEVENTGAQAAEVEAEAFAIECAVPLGVRQARIAPGERVRLAWHVPKGVERWFAEPVRVRIALSGGGEPGIVELPVLVEQRAGGGQE